MLVKVPIWLPCSYRFHYSGCSKTDCIYFGLEASPQVAKFLPNTKDWSRLSRDYVSAPTMTVFVPKISADY